ncbi:MAG: hypothetical protein NTU83_09555, partial [Candidatus Hydrogenedentes bacterium]|nr:hypothetical protein [Candidatus Hydrogenedentota bacterium]
MERNGAVGRPMGEPGNTRALGASTWAVLAAITIAGVLAYANTFSNDFVWDDASSVLVNKHVQDPTELGQLFREDQHPFGRGSGNFYRPLVAASFMADFLASYSAPPPDAPQRSVAEVSPFLFHATNLAWHVLAAAFLYAILLRLGASVWVCAVVPLLYVVHPLHTEAITYISGRADPMAAALGFAGLWLVSRDDTSRQRWMGLVAGTALFAAALLCKESAMIFPFLLALFAVLRPVSTQPKRQAYWRRALPVGVWLAVLAVYASLRMTVLHFASSAPSLSTPGQRLVECCQAFAGYWKLIFVPTGLHMERSLADTPVYAAPIGALLLLGMLAGFALTLWQGRRVAALGIGWFLVSWFPISGLIP